MRSIQLLLIFAFAVAAYAQMQLVEPKQGASWQIGKSQIVKWSFGKGADVKNNKIDVDLYGGSPKDAVRTNSLAVAIPAGDNQVTVETKDLQANDQYFIRLTMRGSDGKQLETIDGPQFSIGATAKSDASSKFMQLGLVSSIVALVMALL